MEKVSTKNIVYTLSRYIPQVCKNYPKTTLVALGVFASLFYIGYRKSKRSPPSESSAGPSSQPTLMDLSLSKV